MSNDFAKFKNSQRRHKTDVIIARQLRIAKQSSSHDTRLDKEPHRLAKHHAMDCGNPKCGLCGNPRHIRKGEDGGRTVQERRQHQDVETVRDKRSNGVNNGDTDQ
jgi:hypothetical protein